MTFWMMIIGCLVVVMLPLLALVSRSRSGRAPPDDGDTPTAGRSDNRLVSAMDDPFDVRTAGDLRVICQVIHIGRRDTTTTIDLVTLEPCGRGDRELPAGSPLTVGFRTSRRDEDQSVLEQVVRGWENRDTVLVLEAADAETGVRYQFTDGTEQLLIVLDERAPGAGS